MKIQIITSTDLPKFVDAVNAALEGGWTLRPGSPQAFIVPFPTDNEQIRHVAHLEIDETKPPLAEAPRQEVVQDKARQLTGERAFLESLVTDGHLDIDSGSPPHRDVTPERARQLRDHLENNMGGWGSRRPAPVILAKLQEKRLRCDLKLANARAEELELNHEAREQIHHWLKTGQYPEGVCPAYLPAPPFTSSSHQSTGIPPVDVGRLKIYRSHLRVSAEEMAVLVKCSAEEYEAIEAGELPFLGSHLRALLSPYNKEDQLILARYLRAGLYPEGPTPPFLPPRALDETNTPTARLHKLRRYRDCPMLELAEWMGISPNRLHELETAHADIPDNLMVRALARFGVGAIPDSRKHIEHWLRTGEYPEGPKPDYLP